MEKSNLNRIYNCNNPYQGKAKRVLCVCSAGLLRSPTAAVVLNQEYGFNTRACGLDVGHALIPLDEVLLTWADEIVCMNAQQGLDISSMIDNSDIPSKPVKVLSIPDSYEYMNEELQDEIRKSYKAGIKS